MSHNCPMAYGRWTKSQCYMSHNCPMTYGRWTKSQSHNCPMAYGRWTKSQLKSLIPNETIQGKIIVDDINCRE